MPTSHPRIFFSKFIHFHTFIFVKATQHKEVPCLQPHRACCSLPEDNPEGRKSSEQAGAEDRTWSVYFAQANKISFQLWLRGLSVIKKWKPFFFIVQSPCHAGSNICLSLSRSSCLHSTFFFFFLLQERSRTRVRTRVAETSRGAKLKRYLSSISLSQSSWTE